MVLGSLLRSLPFANVILIFLIAGLVWVGSGWLEASVNHPMAYYGLLAVVQGFIIVALGSSFPKLASVTVAAAADVFDMGVGTTVGSAIFSILVTPVPSGLATDGNPGANRLVVYKEAQFYMITVATLVVTFSLVVIYFPVPDGPPLTGELTCPIALTPLLLYGLYLFIQWQDAPEHEAENAGVVDGIGRKWARLFGDLLIILVGVEQLVGSAKLFSATFSVSALLADVTVVAAATSPLDTLVSVRSAADGNSATGLGNVSGSSTFDLLVAIPVGVLIVGSIPVDFAVAVPMLGVLTLAAVLLFGLLRADLSLIRLKSYALGTAYLVFVDWVITETAGVTSLLRN